MSRVRVKICGIRDAATAAVAVEAGADALGFVLAPSPRQVTPTQAGEIIASLPPLVAAVGVFVDAPLDLVVELVDSCRFTAVQLHGQEPPAYLRELQRRVRVPLIKAFRVAAPEDLLGVETYPADAYLFDTRVPSRSGGTGQSFDWSLLRGKTFSSPVILAGGLNPENVLVAIQTVRPYAVDVSSGVESEGRKDPEKIRSFLARVKEVSL
ncbi:phosphoribosylanthranilate isomerase [Desulfothermobacter acidiphilus]|uniref:phosphoribosylanthranilate isomerase n=1 Tax=Desulfothermobacter acidiphilus TaxID=1938353 RepID=UPI003F8B52AC